MHEDGKNEVIDTYQAYLRAFRANDLGALDLLVQYPLVYIGNGTVEMVDTYPIKPAEMIASKQWHSTVEAEFEVMGLSPTKAHVVLPGARRLRADGSLIETVSAFLRLHENRCRLEDVRLLGRHRACMKAPRLVVRAFGR